MEPASLLTSSVVVRGEDVLHLITWELLHSPSCVGGFCSLFFLSSLGEKVLQLETSGSFSVLVFQNNFLE